MGGLGFIAGGLMQGAGQGITKMAEDERALAVQQYAANRAMLLQERKISSEESIAKGHDDATKYGADTRVTAAGVAATQSGANNKATNKKDEDIAAANRAAAKTLQDARLTAVNAETFGTKEGENGNMFIIQKDGKTVDTGIKVKDWDHFKVVTNDKTGKVGVGNLNDGTFTPFTDVTTADGDVTPVPKAATGGAALVQALSKPKTGGAAPPLTSTPLYKTPADVLAAKEAGTISYGDAADILTNQFHYKSTNSAAQ